MKRRFAHRKLDRGMTLMEIIVALAVVGLLVAVAVPSVQGYTRANLKSSAGKLSAAIRYVYNYSVTHNKYCRLVFDIDQAQYYSECSEQPFYLKREKEQMIDGGRDERQDEELEEEMNTFGLTDDQIEAAKLKSYKVNFSKVEDRQIDTVELPKNVFFDGVYMEHQEDSYSRGLAYLYFFPSGFTELCTIHLADENENIFTLEVAPLSGKVKVTRGYLEIPIK